MHHEAVDRDELTREPVDALGAPGYLRLSYATSLEKLEAGVERIRGVLADL